MRGKWEQTTKSKKKEDAANLESQGKGQLPLEHFSLINGGKQWPGKTSFVLIYQDVKHFIARSINGLLWGRTSRAEEETAD